MSKADEHAFQTSKLVLFVSGDARSQKRREKLSSPLCDSIVGHDCNLIEKLCVDVAARD